MRNGCTITRQTTIATHNSTPPASTLFGNNSTFKSSKYTKDKYSCKKNSPKLAQFHKKPYLCTAIENERCSTQDAETNLGIWCNGNTTDSGPVFPGSSPGIPTKKRLHSGVSFFCLFTIYPSLLSDADILPVWKSYADIVTGKQNEKNRCAGKKRACSFRLS